jgi:hypothetical protein
MGSLSLDQATRWETIDKFDGQASMYNDIGEAHQEQNRQPPYQEGHNSHTVKRVNIKQGQAISAKGKIINNTYKTSTINTAGTLPASRQTERLVL